MIQFIVILFLVSWPCCHMSEETTTSNVTRQITVTLGEESNITEEVPISLDEEEMPISLSEENKSKPVVSSSGLVLLVFLLIVLILLMIVLFLINVFICELLKPLACFKDDSICLCVNRELNNLVDDEEEEESDGDDEEVPNLAVKVKPSKSDEQNNSEKVILAENRKLINYYGVEDTEEIIRSQSPHHLTPSPTPMRAQAQTTEIIEEKSTPIELLELGSFKTTTRTLTNNNKSNNSASTSNNIDASIGPSISGETIATDDLKPVFYELDELEKRLSESLCELVKMRTKNEMERLNECLIENMSIDELNSSLIGTTSSNEPNESNQGNQDVKETSDDNNDNNKN